MAICVQERRAEYMAWGLRLEMAGINREYAWRVYPGIDTSSRHNKSTVKNLAFFITLKVGKCAFVFLPRNRVKKGLNIRHMVALRTRHRLRQRESPSGKLCSSAAPLYSPKGELKI